MQPKIVQITPPPEEMGKIADDGDGAPTVYRERADSHATSSVGSWDSEHLPWYRRAVNLLSSVALMMVIAVATCTVISSVFLYTSMNAGLKETRSSCDRGINEIRVVAGESLDYVGTYMMDFSATSIKNSVTSYLESGFVVCLHLHMVVTDLLGHLPKNETVFFDSAAKWLWQEGVTGDHIRRYGHPATYTVIGMYYGNTGQGVSFGTSVQAWPGREWAPTAYETRNDITMIGPALNQTGMLDPAYRRPFVIKSSQIATLRIMQEGLMKPGEMKMTQLEIVGGFLGYPMGIQIQDPISPRILQGIVWIGMENLQAFLQTLAASANTTKERPRIFCLIRKSWIADAFKARNDPSWVDYDQVGYLTGTSHGNATNNTWGWDPVRQENRMNSKPSLAVDADDLLTRNIARHLERGVGYENASRNGIRNENIVDTTNASAPDNYQFVGVFSLSKPHEGLDWWLVMSMDAEAILAEVTAQAIQTGMLIEKDRERVQSNINTDVRNTVFAVVGAALFVLIISCVLVMLLLRPLARVQKAMRRVARMDLEGLDITADSIMCEMRQMQGDFTSMVEALLEFRAYVPSSLLGSSGGISRAVDPPSGNVAVMFTDIQQSTALWKRNSEDMNEALEMHNQVIRSACGPTEGYEVKTIGDAFMVSFQSAEAAVRCALDIQTRLAEEEWPERLGLTQAGLVIRIGINYGSTISEENPVTGRVDYRGSTINMASRLEAKALGGTVCISSDMYATIRPELAGLGDPLVRSFGTHDLKGLGEHQLYIMVPQHMKRRLTPETSDCNPPSADHLRQRSSLSFEKSSQLSSGGLGESLVRLNRKQEKAANSKTGLKFAARSSDTSQFDNCNTMVRVCCDFAASTGGVVGSISGSTLAILWNASKPCRGHAMAGISFAAQVQKRTGEYMRVGVATGCTLHGNIGTQKNRFTTATGVALEAARAVCDLAYSAGVFCLYADCTPQGKALDVSIETSVGLVDLWYSLAHRASLRIHTLDTEQLRNRLGMWDEDDRQVAERAAAQRQHITEYCTEDTGAEKRLQLLGQLRAIAEEGGCAVLKRSIEVLATSTPTMGCRCLVTFTNMPPEIAREKSNWEAGDDECRLD